MISLGNIVLRNWQKQDIKDLFKNANNKEIRNNLRDELPYSYAEMAARQ